MNKKRGLALGLIIILSVLPLVSAQILPYDWGSTFRQAIENVEDILTPIFEALLGTGSGEYFFAKVLLFLLLFFVIFTVVGKIPNLGDNAAVVFIIATVVSILSIRYLPEDTFILALMLPYSTMGMAIAVFLPFLIYFFFVHTSVPGTFGRRIAWIVFGIVFLFLWIVRGAELGSANWVYAAGVGAVFISFLFDSSVHRYFQYAGLSRAVSKEKERIRRDIKREMFQLAEDWKRGIISKSEYNSAVKDLKRKYKSL